MVKRSRRDSSLDGHKTIVIGGPAYGMQVSAKHADTVAYLALAFRLSGWKVSVWHRHSSILTENRDALLRGSIERGADILLSIDADTYLDDDAIHTSILATVNAANMLIERDELAHIYAIVAPVQQRNGKWNVTDKEGNHLYERPTQTLVIPTDGAWCAFAFALHRCASYYEWFETGDPFYMFGYAKDRYGSDRSPWIGEDSYHSLTIGSKGGKIIVEPQIQTGHDIQIISA